MPSSSSSFSFILHPSSSSLPSPTVKLNPYGVLPMGNYFIDCTSPTFVDARQIGLGILSCLPDNVFSFILNELNAEDLSKLALVSKAFYVHVNEDDELWKFFTVAEFGGDFRFRNGTWQETFKAARIERRLRQLFASSSSSTSSTSSTSVPSLIEKEAQENFILKEVNRLVPPHIPIRVSGFYSDLLHHAWSCRSAWLQQWALAPDTIERRSALTMSREDFER